MYIRALPVRDIVFLDSSRYICSALILHLDMPREWTSGCDRKGGAVHAGGRNFRRQERSGAGMVSLLEDEPFLNGESAGCFGRRYGGLRVKLVKTCVLNYMGLAREPRILYWSLLAGCAHLLIKHILRWWTSERRLEFASNRFIQGPLHTVKAAHGRTTYIGGGRDSCG